MDQVTNRCFFVVKSDDGERFMTMSSFRKKNIQSRDSARGIKRGAGAAGLPTLRWIFQRVRPMAAIERKARRYFERAGGGPITSGMR